MYQYIKEKSELKIGEFMELLGTTLAISIDVEASSIDTITAEWILFQVKLGDSIYVFDARTLDRKFLSYLLDLINCSQKPIIAHNSKYDLKIIFRGTGILLQNIHDTMLIESILYRGIGKVFYTLAELVELYTGEILLKDVRATFESFKGELSIEQLSYAAMDVLYLETIYNKQLEFISQKNLDKIYRLEMDLVPVLVRMELAGIYLDKDEWLALKEQAVKDREKSHNKILDMFIQKADFNKYANGAILADAFRIPIKTKKTRLALESLIDPSVLKD